MTKQRDSETLRFRWCQVDLDAVALKDTDLIDLTVAGDSEVIVLAEVDDRHGLIAFKHSSRRW
jgi:hypothetical protein